MSGRADSAFCASRPALERRLGWRSLSGRSCWTKRTDLRTIGAMADVVTTGEAREALHRIARQFDAGEGEPVYFGSHRRAQGVIVPVEVWEQLLESAEDDLDAEFAQRRLADSSGARRTRSDLDNALRQAAEAARRPV